MKNAFRLLLGSIFAVASLGLAAPAFAGTPVLSASVSGNSYVLTVNNADANAPVTLYLSQGSSTWSHIYNWGTTDGNGSFTVTQGLPFDGSSNPLQLYVTVDGIQSGTIQVTNTNSGSCTSGSTNCGSGALSLSQSTIALNTNQSYVVTAYPTTGSAYLSNNNNTSAVAVSVSNNQVNITGVATGSAIVTVCANNGSQCSNITVSVNGASTSGITFSNSSPTIILGQSQTINVYSSSGSTNGFYIANNSNSNTVNATLNGSVITLASQAVGTASVNVCQTGTGFCSAISVTVGSNGTTASMTISTNTLNIATGQTGTATISNSYGTLYISSNSNNSVVSAGISGQTISVYGISAGSSTLTICQNGYSGCVSLYVVVSGTGSTISGSLSFSTANPVLTLGQSQNITIYSPNSNSNSYYVNTNSNSSAVSTSISGSTMTLFGQNAGVATINICANSSSYCGNVYATVNGYSGGVTFSQSTLNMNLNQTATLTVSGGTSSYVLTSNTSPSAVSASISGSTINLTALNNGSATITVCQSGNTSACGQAIVTVGQSVSSGIVTFSNNAPSVAVGQSSSISIYATNGYSGSYSITTNTNPNIATVSISGTSLMIAGVSSGLTNITICQTGSSVCGNVALTIGTGASGAVTITTGVLAAGNVGQVYTASMSSTGGDGTYAYTITSGSLPVGLTMSTTGIITGAPTAAGTSNFTVSVTSGGNTNTANFSITIGTSSSTTTNTTTDTSTTAGNGQLTSGQLINESGTICMVYKNTKTPFANAAAFLGLGFSFSNVTTVTNSGLSLSGRVVVTAKGAHPRGTWLLSGKAVYFLTPQGTIPVPSWDVFVSNGGQASFLVKANSNDLAMPKLSVMTANDSRVR